MATATNSPQSKEASMSQPITFSVLCPQCSEAVAEATDLGFTATTVDIKCCSTCRKAGYLAYTVRKTAAYRLADKLDRSEGLRHRDGLVVFGGSI
jgi:hypothetical protein